MDILIKNMEMPQNGALTLTIHPNGDVGLGGCIFTHNFGKEVKAIELPPHGRLIDVEPIEKEVKTWTSAGLDKYDFLYELDHAEVVLEAST